MTSEQKEKIDTNLHLKMKFGYFEFCKQRLLICVLKTGATRLDEKLEKMEKNLIENGRNSPKII